MSRSHNHSNPHLPLEICRFHRDHRHHGACKDLERQRPLGQHHAQGVNATIDGPRARGAKTSPESKDLDYIYYNLAPKGVTKVCFRVISSPESIDRDYMYYVLAPRGITKVCFRVIPSPESIDPDYMYSVLAPMGVTKVFFRVIPSPESIDPDYMYYVLAPYGGYEGIL